MEIKTIKARELIEVKVDMNTTGKDLNTGDLYVAKRNPMVGWLLLKCHKVDFKHGWVVPEDGEYCFNFGECHKVITE